MKLPTYPVKGEPATAELLREIIDYLRAITPQPSGSIRVNTGPGGTTFSREDRAQDDALLSPDRHFDVVQLSDTSVKVLAGPAIRYAAGQQYVVAMGVDGPATSTSLAAYLTISGITATTHIVLDLDSPLAPTTLTASSTGSATYPTGDTTYARRVLALVTCADGVITSIEQYENGAWRDPWLQLDSVSLGFEDDLLAEIAGWEDGALTTPWPEDGEVMGRPTAHGAPFWATPEDLLNSIAPEDWDDLEGYITGLIPAPPDWAHNVLTDVEAGTAGDDHVYPNYSYLGNVADYMRNACTYGLGDSAGNASVAVSDRQLQYDGKVVFDWEIGLINDADELDSIDAFLRTLYGVWIGSDATDITPATHASGALQLAGGVSIAKRVQIESDEEGNIAGNTGALRVTGGATFLKRVAVATAAIYAILDEAGAAGSFGDGVSTAQICNGSFALEATAGGINCNASAAYCHGGVIGATETSRTLRIPLDDGTVLEAKLRGGILCAT